MIKVILLNQDKDIIKGRMRLTVVDTLWGDIIEDSFCKVNIGTKDLTEIKSVLRKNLPRDKNWILAAFLYNESDEIICRNYYLTKPWKHVKLREPKIELELLKNVEETELILKSNDPAFFIDLYHPQLSFSDRGFIILPGEKVKLKILEEQIKPINLNDIKIFSLNSYLQHK